MQTKQDAPQVYVDEETEKALRRAVSKLEVEDPSDQKTLTIALSYKLTKGNAEWLRALIRRQGAKYKP